jgi:hypothetical protein
MFAEPFFSTTLIYRAKKALIYILVSTFENSSSAYLWSIQINCASRLKINVSFLKDDIIFTLSMLKKRHIFKTFYSAV